MEIHIYEEIDLTPSKDQVYRPEEKLVEEVCQSIEENFPEIREKKRYTIDMDKGRIILSDRPLRQIRKLVVVDEKPFYW